MPPRRGSPATRRAGAPPAGGSPEGRGSSARGGASRGGDTWGGGGATHAAGAPARRRLSFRNAGLLTQGRIRRILDLAGWDLTLAPPRGPEDRVAVWGQGPVAARGARLAEARGAPLLHIEDAFLRSVLPGRLGARAFGRAGSPPIGLITDESGLHYDPARPSDLETLLATHPLDDTVLLDRARAADQRIRHAHLSKYSNFDPAAPLPEPPYVLVIDQTEGDGAVRASGAGRATFLDMLTCARAEHPGNRIVIKAHPETAAGLRPGHFGPGDAGGQVSLLTDPVSPWALFEGATAVYTVSSQLGFEAIMAGHRPHVFGQPFYAGWGLTQDRAPLPRRSRRLTRAQLFAAAMILYPLWYDPARDRLCELEDVISQLEAEARAWREDRAGHVMVGISRWKRPHLARFFGACRKPRFAADPARALRIAGKEGRGILAWASRAPEGLGEAAAAREIPLARIEDGFLRSRGLGARLTPPLSLVRDDLAIHYDPARPSRLERLIAESPALPPAEIARAEALIARINALGLSKYNLPDLAPGLPPDLSPGFPDTGGAAAGAPGAGRRVILVAGQVEDDAAVLKGATGTRGNLALLRRARAENPDALLIWKPHPDVEAGLRPGALAAQEALAHADLIAAGADPAALIAAADEIWTITSTLGFEALLRGRAVTCLGAPFYAGWGLTRDLGPVPARRARARFAPKITLAGLAHAALIAYPRYLDPVSGLPCPPEVIVERLAAGAIPPRGALLGLMARLQRLVPMPLRKA